MSEEWVKVPGIIVEGHRVASGPSQAYPYGSLEKQKPGFTARGLDLEPYFPGTLNISIAPLCWEMIAAQYTFREVAWTDLHPPEDFSFSACRVYLKGQEFPGWIYYPNPETKIRHFSNPSLIEVITDFIPGIGYGTSLQVEVHPDEVRIYEK